MTGRIGGHRRQGGWSGGQRRPLDAPGAAAGTVDVRVASPSLFASAAATSTGIVVSINGGEGGAAASAGARGQGGAGGQGAELEFRDLSQPFGSQVSDGYAPSGEAGAAGAAPTFTGAAAANGADGLSSRDLRDRERVCHASTIHLRGGFMRPSSPSIRYPRLLVLAVAFTGIASGSRVAMATLAPGYHSGRTILVGAATRTYDVYVPASYDGSQPYPLVLDFHFLGGTASMWGGTSGFRTLADAAHFLVAFPQGIGGVWNAGICCPPSPTTDDVGFARALVADLVSATPIDTDRVYATGFSMGSAMTQRLACDAADVFTAIAPFAAQLVVPFPACVPAAPVAVLYTHGLDDTVVPYAGGPTLPYPSVSVPPAVDSFRFLAQINGCCANCLADPVSEPSTLVDTLGDGDPATRCEAYASCAGGVTVELCSERTGHGVPAGGVERAWAFMQSHVRGATTTTTSTTTSTTTTLPAADCPDTLRLDCVAPLSMTSSLLKLRDDPDPMRKRLLWKWRSGATVLPEQLGVPTVDASYALCLYDGSGALFHVARIPAAADCDGVPCWRGLGKPVGVLGWKFKDKTRRYDGVASILVKPGARGKSKAAFKAGTPAPAVAPFAFPSPPLGFLPTVQLGSDTGGCMTATMLLVEKDVPGAFVARGGY